MADSDRVRISDIQIFEVGEEMIAAKGKYICEPLDRTRQLSSGLWLADKLSGEKKDNMAKVLAVGSSAVKTCSKCHDKQYCRRPCREKNRQQPILAGVGEIVHYKSVYAQKLKYKGKTIIFLTNEDIIAVENGAELRAVGSMVIIRRILKEKMGSFFVPDNAKVNSGDYYGEVIAIGPDYPDKDLKIGDKVIYLRSEGYTFRPYYGEGKETLFSVKEFWIYGKENI